MEMDWKDLRMSAFRRSQLGNSLAVAQTDVMEKESSGSMKLRPKTSEADHRRLVVRSGQA
jgi:hypothetical protein